MIKRSWVCRRCGFKEDLNSYYYRCPKCYFPIDLEYDIEWKPSGWGIYRYKSMLPYTPLISLGEGFTPLVVRELRGVKIWFKLEYLNPSGSFKDRGSVMALSLARSLNYERVIEDSSGNTGVSVALYAQALGLKAEIIVPAAAPLCKKNLIKLFKAAIIEVGDRGRASEEALKRSEVSKAFYVAHAWSPTYLEANKTIAYEAFEQGFRGDAIITPIGSGGLLLGLYKGFSELVELGFIKDLPTIIGVQGVSIRPVYEAIHGVVEIKGDSSIADGIMVPNPPRLNEIASAITKTGGEVVLVNNNEIVQALRELINLGFLIEPTSAAALAALNKVINEGVRIREALIPLTGSGLKMIDDIAKLLSF
ncbi:MAG: pyridoxal-phosphate dependent enzyme [Sulfolobales archaeon]|nr:pyridoxal-phosphate dependent enzyme [Sulfolobales archaeon]